MKVVVLVVLLFATLGVLASGILRGDSKTINPKSCTCAPCYCKPVCDCK